METCAFTPLDRPATELTTVDVYDIAAVLGHELERVMDRFGCEPLVGLVHKVVRVLELLEALVSRGAAAQEADELRTELDRLRQERSQRRRQDRRHQEVCVCVSVCACVCGGEAEEQPTPGIVWSSQGQFGVQRSGLGQGQGLGI